MKVSHLSAKYSLQELRKVRSTDCTLRFKCNKEIRTHTIGAFIAKLIDAGCCLGCGLAVSYGVVGRFKEGGAKVYCFGTKNGRGIVFNKDHIKPLSCGGLDVIENIQALCSECNNFKGSSVSPNPIFWALRRKIEANIYCNIQEENLHNGLISSQCYEERSRKMALRLKKAHLRAMNIVPGGLLEAGV